MTDYQVLGAALADFGVRSADLEAKIDQQFHELTADERSSLVTGYVDRLIEEGNKIGSVLEIISGFGKFLYGQRDGSVLGTVVEKLASHVREEDDLRRLFEKVHQMRLPDQVGIDLRKRITFKAKETFLHEVIYSLNIDQLQALGEKLEGTKNYFDAYSCYRLARNPEKELEMARKIAETHPEKACQTFERLDSYPDLEKLASYLLAHKEIVSHSNLLEIAYKIAFDLNQLEDKKRCKAKDKQLLEKAWRKIASSKEIPYFFKRKDKEGRLFIAKKLAARNPETALTVFTEQDYQGPELETARERYVRECATGPGYGKYDKFRKYGVTGEMVVKLAEKMLEEKPEQALELMRYFGKGKTLYLVAQRSAESNPERAYDCLWESEIKDAELMTKIRNNLFDKEGGMVHYNISRYKDQEGAKLYVERFGEKHPGNALKLSLELDCSEGIKKMREVILAQPLPKALKIFRWAEDRESVALVTEKYAEKIGTDVEELEKFIS